MSETLNPARERPDRAAWADTALLVGFTAIFAGYFMVWLPGPGVGLQFIGLELGEWIKFLGVGAARDLFYLPPIILGLLLGLHAAGWDNRRWQTWAMRALAVAVALLAFPAVAAIQLEPSSQWLPRLLLIGLVGAVALLGALLPGGRIVLVLMALVALAGALLPTWQYLQVRPLVEEILRRPVGVGIGVWVNLAGCLLVAGVCAWRASRAGAAR